MRARIAAENAFRKLHADALYFVAARSWLHPVYKVDFAALVKMFDPRPRPAAEDPYEAQPAETAQDAFYDVDDGTLKDEGLDLELFVLILEQIGIQFAQIDAVTGMDTLRTTEFEELGNYCAGDRSDAAGNGGVGGNAGERSGQTRSGEDMGCLLAGLRLCGPDKHVMYWCGNGTRRQGVWGGGLSTSRGRRSELRSHGSCSHGYT